MSYSNKLFNVNGYGEQELHDCLQLAISNSDICGYKIDNEVGLEIFISNSLIPNEDNVIVYDSPASLENEMPVILSYLEQLKNVINFSEQDAVNEKLLANNEFNYRLGWRVFSQLIDKDDKLWWNHSIFVRPSYILNNGN